MLLLGLAPVASPAQVISAPIQIDQPDAPSTVAASGIALRRLLFATQASQSAAEATRALTPGDLLMFGLAALIVGLFLGLGWYRLTKQPGPDPLDPVLAIGLFLAMLLLRQVGAAAALAAFGIALPADQSSLQLSVQQLAQLALGAYGGQSIGVFAYLWLRRITNPRTERHRTGTIKAILASAGVLALTWPVMIAVGMLASRLLHAPPTPIAHETLDQMIKAGIDAWWIALAALVVVAAPVVEELMYRGLLQPTLERVLGRWPAIVATSLVFALMHYNVIEPHALPSLFVLSLSLGWAYRKTGRLIAPITMHALFNAANLLLAMQEST